MEMNFNKQVVGFGGLPIVHEAKNENGNAIQKPVTFAELIGRQLFYVGADNSTFSNSGNSPFSDEDKMRAYHLSVQMAERPEKVEVSAADCVLIEKIASKCFVAGIYGQIYDLVERKG